MRRHSTSVVPAYFDQILGDFDPARSSRAVHLGFWQNAQQPRESFDDFLLAQTRLNDWLLGELGAEDGDCILDVGCGLGATLESLNGSISSARLVGVNIDERQLQACRTLAAQRNNRLQWQLADACSLPFSDSSIDAVISVEAMFHFSSRKRFFSEVARVLKPGGQFVATDMIVSESLLQLPTPGFLVEAALQDGYGPWPDFWGKEADHTALAENAGLQSLWYRDISCETLPSYRFTTPSKIDWQNDSHDIATRSALTLRWLHENNYLSYVAMAYQKPS